MKSYEFNSKYGKYMVNLQFGEYSNGRIALSLNDSNDGFPICKATVNIPEIEISEGDVIIKDYLENEGVLKFLTDNNIVLPPSRLIYSGYAVVYICKLLVKSN